MRSKGVCVWITGLNGPNMLAIANNLADVIRQRGVYGEIIDDQTVRNLTGNDQLNKTGRNYNVYYIISYAKETMKYGGIAICTIIDPDLDTKLVARRELTLHGVFIEVCVAIPNNVSETNDIEESVEQFGPCDMKNEPSEHPEIVVGKNSEGPAISSGVIIDYLLDNYLI